MRRTLIATAFVAVCAFESAAAADAPQHVCLQASEIKTAGVLDNRTILFTMNNGTQWKNTLQTDCPGLRTANAFDYVIRESEVCGNEQRIRVHGGPSVCFLGPFTPVTNK